MTRRCILARVVLGSLAFLAGFSPLLGQPQGRPRPAFTGPGLITREQGESFLAEFRDSRPDGDFAWDFRVLSRPRRGAEQVFHGRVWARWDQDGPWLRLRLESAPDDAPGADLLLRGGPSPRVWTWDLASSSAVELEGDAWFRPLVGAGDFAAFDLVMPFLHWPEWEYEGGLRVRGRPAHRFLFYPPTADPSATRASAVRVSLDSGYRALLQADVLDFEGKPVRSAQVVGFRQVQGQWILKAVDFVDTTTRDRSRFEVIGAAQGLRLPAAIFVPGKLGERPELPDESAFSRW